MAAVTKNRTYGKHYTNVLIKDPLGNVPAKSGCSFSGKEVNNV
jgi:hypothetical protein